MVKHLGVVGAGTMGAVIAQIAALAGIETSLYDINGTVLRQALERIKTNLKSGMEHGILSESQTVEALGRIHQRTRLNELNHSEIVVEAVIEDLRIKKDLLRHLEADTKPTTILATTTSSLSVTAVGSATRHPEKVVGLHFLNPATSATLVEVVRGQHTSAETVQRSLEFTIQLSKTAVVVNDGPGFIVNRLIQPFHGEALRILGERIADHIQIDRLMKVLGGFESGPFESMDHLGLDSSLSITQSLYEQSSGEPRYRPHPIMKRMVDSGMLGRKSGNGFYTYADSTK
jgi:3-hydroxybutyryl-CoA dehydrogenase